MSGQLSRLEIVGPDGRHLDDVELTVDRVTVGRLPEVNVVTLQPDPQQLVTRHAHCILERDEAGWWLSDNGSVNGTYMLASGEIEPVSDRRQLIDGAVVCILGLLTDAGEPKYWVLTFRDPSKTRQAVFPPRPPCVEYDWVQAKLFLRDRGTPRAVEGLRPQEHKLVRYMVRRNQDNADVPVLCTHEELLKAIWDEEAELHSREELARIVWEVRQKLKNPRLIENERTQGYRLNTCRRND